MEEAEPPVEMELRLEILPPSPPAAPPEPIPAPPVQPAHLPPPPPAPPAPPVEKVIESLNRPRTKMCQKHPAWKATEFCPECSVMKCKNCMTEKNGRTLCSECAKKLQYH